MEVFWTEKAIETYNNVIDYLYVKWTEKVVSDFVQKTHKTLDIISTNNVKFRSAGKRNVHEILITKHNLLIYRIKNKNIELLTFYDTRQNPKKKKF